jgi:hypothetical protein
MDTPGQGEGITNLTFSDQSGPMCSGSLFERYGRDGLWDAYSLWVTSTWPTPYIVVIRGMVSQNGYLSSRRGRSLPANAGGFDTHRDPISSRFDCRTRPTPAMRGSSASRLASPSTSRAL